jgi:hypothetical protein
MPRKQIPVKTAEAPTAAPQVRPEPQPHEWKRIPAIVARFGISRTTIYRRIDEGTIVAAKDHGIRVVDARSVEAMLAAGIGK